MAKISDAPPGHLTAPSDASGAFQPISLEKLTHSYHEFVWSAKDKIPKEVSLVGSWDGWTEYLALERIEGSYRALKALEPGHYEFKFVVDSEWQIDSTQRHEKNTDGHLNNVLDVPSQLSDETHVIDPIPLDPSVSNSSGAAMLSYNRIGHVPPDFLPPNAPIQLQTPLQHVQNATLGTMQLFPLAFTAHASSPLVKQTSNPLYGSVRWDFSPAELSRQKPLLFYIDLPSIQFIDSIDLDLGILRPWLGWVQTRMAHEYSLSIAYHSNSGWIDYARRYTITHLLAHSPYSSAETPSSNPQKLEAGKGQVSTLPPLPSDSRVRRCSLSVNIRAQNLCIALHADPEATKSSLSRSSSSASVGGSSEGGSSTPRLSLSLPPSSSNPLLNLSKAPHDGSSRSSSWRKQFTFSGEHFDRNGLLFWLGTNEGREKLWQNPSLTGKLGLEISHPKLTTGEMKKHNVIARQSVESTFWGGSAPLWFTVDLGLFYRFSPSYYTLRHGHSSPNSYIRDWSLQASHDGNDWVKLHSQVEAPFTHGFDVQSFPVPQFPEHYRYIRVLQNGNYSMTGANASGPSEDAGAPFMCISGFELYGELVTAQAKPAANLITSVSLCLRSLTPVKNRVQTMTFKHQSDFDTRGILYHIATNGGSEPYTNPSESGRVDLTLSHAELHSATMSKHNIIAHANSNATFWGGSTPQWFVVDLRSSWVTVTAYSLRHGYTAANSFLREWEFAGSIDGQNWVTLHIGHDAPFTKGFDTETWAIKDCTDSYRYFRVLQRGNYSMGSSGSAGAPYMCIAGFELYGELTGMRVPPDTQLDYTTSQMRRTQRQAFYANRELHLQLLQLAVAPSTGLESRNKCLDMLIDICSHTMIPLAYHKANTDLPAFFKNCLLHSSTLVSSKASHFLGNILLASRPAITSSLGVQPPADSISHQSLDSNFAKDTLDLAMELLASHVTEFASPHSLNLILDIFLAVWDQDPDQAHATCATALHKVSELLHRSRSPYYNLLRSQYGIHEFALEKCLFRVSKPTEGRITDKFHISDSLNYVGKTADELSLSLCMAQYEFGVKCHALRSLLDELYALQAFESYTNDVIIAVDQCIRYQSVVGLILDQLKSLVPDHPSVASFMNDSLLDRLEYTTERLLYVLNVQCGNIPPQSSSQSTNSTASVPGRRRSSAIAQFQHPIEYLMEIFNNICLHTSPSVVEQAVRFLTPELGSHLAFPATILTKYLSSAAKYEDPTNIFPQESVFNSMVEIISNEKYRVSFSDSLFDLLDQICSQSTRTSVPGQKSANEKHSPTESHSANGADLSQGLDAKLLNWTVLLLSKLTKANNDPPHVGSTCRACNMSPIRGTRFRCANCADYDICERCEGDPERQHDAGHVFVKISKPLPLPPASPRNVPNSKELLLPTLLYPDVKPWTELTKAHLVACNHCGSPSIVGVRYKCCQCENFNLCELCEPKATHLPMHLFLKIIHPLPAASTARALIPVVLHKGFYSSASTAQSNQHAAWNRTLGLASLGAGASGGRSRPKTELGLPAAGTPIALPSGITVASSVRASSPRSRRSPKSPRSPSIHQTPERAQMNEAHATQPISEFVPKSSIDNDLQFTGKSDQQLQVQASARLDQRHLVESSPPPQGPIIQYGANGKDDKVDLRSPLITQSRMRNASSTADVPSQVAPSGKPAGLQHTKTETMLLSIIQQEEEDVYQQWLLKQTVLARQRTHLRAALRLLFLASNLRPIITDLFFLASRILLELVKQQNLDDVIEDVLQNSELPKFFSNVAELDPLIQSESLHLCQTLCLPETYLGQGQTEVTIGLRTARSILRSTVVALIESRLPQSLSLGHIHASQARQYAESNGFLLALLLITETAGSAPPGPQKPSESMRNVSPLVRRAISPQKPGTPGTGDFGDSIADTSLPKRRKASWNPSSELLVPNDSSQQLNESTNRSIKDSPITDHPYDRLVDPFFQMLQAMSLNSPAMARLWSTMLKPIRHAAPASIALSPSFVPLLKIALNSANEYSKLVEPDILALLRSVAETSAVGVLIPQMLEIIIETLPKVTKSALLASCIQLAVYHIRFTDSSGWETSLHFVIPQLLGVVANCLDTSPSDLQLLQDCLVLAISLIDGHCDLDKKFAIVSALSHSTRPETVASQLFRILVGHGNIMVAPEGPCASPLVEIEKFSSELEPSWFSIHQLLIRIFLSLAQGTDQLALKVSLVAYQEAKNTAYLSELIHHLVLPLLGNNALITQFWLDQNVCNELISDIIATSGDQANSQAHKRASFMKNDFHLPASLTRTIALEDTQFVGHKAKVSSEGKGSQLSHAVGTVSQIEGLDNLAHLSRVLQPPDPTLSQLLHGNLGSSNGGFSHKEQPLMWTIDTKGPKSDSQLVVLVELLPPAIVRQVRLQFVQDQGFTHYAVPNEISMEHGISIAGLLPSLIRSQVSQSASKSKSIGNKAQSALVTPTKAELTTAMQDGELWKLELENAELVRFLRISVAMPTGSTLALSKFQILGNVSHPKPPRYMPQTLLRCATVSFNSSIDKLPVDLLSKYLPKPPLHSMPSPSNRHKLSDRLPTSAAIALLNHVVPKCPEGARHLAHHALIRPFIDALFLTLPDKMVAIECLDAAINAIVCYNPELGEYVMARCMDSAIVARHPNLFPRLLSVTPTTPISSVRGRIMIAIKFVTQQLMEATAADEAEGSFPLQPNRSLSYLIPFIECLGTAFSRLPQHTLQLGSVPLKKGTTSSQSSRLPPNASSPSGETTTSLEIPMDFVNCVLRAACTSEETGGLLAERATALLAVLTRANLKFFDHITNQAFAFSDSESPPCGPEKWRVLAILAISSAECSKILVASPAIDTALSPIRLANASSSRSIDPQERHHPESTDFSHKASVPSPFAPPSKPGYSYMRLPGVSHHLVFLGLVCRGSTVAKLAGTKIIDCLFPCLTRRQGSPLFEAAMEFVSRLCTAYPPNLTRFSGLYSESFLNSGPLSPSKRASTTSTTPSTGEMPPKHGTPPSEWHEISSTLNGAMQALYHVSAVERKVYWHLSPRTDQTPLWDATAPVTQNPRCEISRPTLESLALSRLGRYDQSEDMIVDPNNSNSALKISEDGRTITATNGQQRWRTAICSNVLRNGVFYWEVTISKMNAGNVIIGVSEASHDLSCWIGQTNASRGWAYHGAGTNKGYTYHSGSFNSSYGKIMCEGDVVGVTLDLIEGTLSFSLNGTSLGVAYSNLTRQEVHPAISLIDSNDSICFSSPIYVLQSQSISFGAQTAASPLGPTNPLRLMRFEHSVYESSPQVTLGLIKNTLANSLPPEQREIELELDVLDLNGNCLPDLDDSISLGDIRTTYSSRLNEIIDFKFAMRASTLPTVAEAGTQPIDTSDKAIPQSQAQAAAAQKLEAVPVPNSIQEPSLLVEFANMGTIHPLIELILTRLTTLHHCKDRALALPAGSGFEPLLDDIPPHGLISPMYQDVVLVTAVDKNAIPAFQAHFKSQHPTPSVSTAIGLNDTETKSKDGPAKHGDDNADQKGETSEPSSSASKSSSHSNPDSKTGSKVPGTHIVPLGLWVQWLSLLRALSSIDGFMATFSSDPTCMCIFNEILKDAQISIAPIQRVRDLNRFDSDWKALLPRAVWSSPIQCLFNVLIHHLDSNSASAAGTITETEHLERNLLIRNHMATSGSLVSILVALSNAAAVPHREPNSPWFKTANEDLDARKRLLERKSKAHVSDSSPSSSSKPSDASGAKKHWAKGTGYGTSEEEVTGTANSKSAPNVALASSNHAAVLSLHTLLISYLQVNSTSPDLKPDDPKERGSSNFNLQPALCREAYDILIASCLGPSLHQYLKNDSLLDMGKYFKRYETAFELCSLILQHPQLAPLLSMPTAPLSTSATLRSSISALHEVISMAHKKLGFRRLRDSSRSNSPMRGATQSNGSGSSNGAPTLANLKLQSAAPSPKRLRSSAPVPVPSAHSSSLTPDPTVLSSSSNTALLVPTASPSRYHPTPPHSPLRLSSPSLATIVVEEADALDEQTRMMNWIVHLEQLASTVLDPLKSSISVATLPSSSTLDLSLPVPNLPFTPSKSANPAELTKTSHDLTSGQLLASSAPQSIDIPASSCGSSENEFLEYKTALEALQFDEMEMEVDGEYHHHYRDKVASDLATNASKMRWLTHEIGTLSMGLPLHWSSSVFLRIDSSRIDVMKVVITGPKDTPYEDGIFIFDVYCPADYPKVPPLVNLQTTGSGSVRFNPNLYNCGKVCLSLLGTWRGGPNEMWQENESTLLQVFVSIQSLIFVDEPYFNEPGFENMMGTAAGRLESSLYNETIRLGTLRWAILDHLRNPPKGFEQVAQEHFTIKRVPIMKTCLRWLEEAKLSTTNGYMERLQKLVTEIEAELQALKPFVITLEATQNDSTPLTNVNAQEHTDPRWKMALQLQTLFSQFPVGLIHRALEICSDQQNTAMDWLFDNGERYAEEHPNVVTQLPPAE
jgi:ubiquitin-protein ligase